MKPLNLCARGLRYIRRYGALKLVRKVRERWDRNRAEQGYAAWLKAQLPDDKEQLQQKELAAKLAFAPVISILVPAYETPELFLHQMMDSVLKQSYGRLELCIADGSPGDLVERVVKEYAERDPRVRYQRLKHNLGISQNTNKALEMASGAYVGLLDHDDLLLPGALFEIVKALNEVGEADAVYTDEDKVTWDLSRHFQPHFKPDYNEELLRSTNYICHFFLVRRELALSVGGFREAFDGAQDYDFIFRCTEKANRVLHVPRVLYSWRESAGSTATNPESKLYAYEAGKRAVAAHLARLGEAGEAEDTDNYGFYHVRYPGFPYLCSENIRNSFENFNGQTDVKVVYYNKACNKSVTFLKKEQYLLFTCVRNARVNEHFLETLKACLARPGVGAACARVYDQRGRLRNDIVLAGMKDPFSKGMQGLWKGYTGYFHRAVLQQELAVPTDCFLVKGELLEGLSDCGIPELCAKLKEKGARILYEPWAVMYEVR